jgi:hypothetical protein
MFEINRENYWITFNTDLLARKHLVNVILMDSSLTVVHNSYKSILKSGDAML